MGIPWGDPLIPYPYVTCRHHWETGEVLPHFAELDSALGVSSQNGQRETTHLATLTQRESKLGLYYNLVLFPANITLLE